LCENGENQSLNLKENKKWGTPKRGEWFGFWTDMDGADFGFRSQQPLDHQLNDSSHMVGARC